MLLLPEILLSETLSFELLSVLRGRKLNIPVNITITATVILQTVEDYGKLITAHKCLISPGRNEERENCQLHFYSGEILQYRSVLLILLFF